MKEALILVDIQYDFLSGGALEVPDGNAILPVVNRIQISAGLVVATQDWHPEGHLSFASAHEGKKPFDVIDLNGQEQVLWPDHCVQGSQGARFHESLETRSVETIFRKGMDREIDSYSGFYDNGHRKNTGLSGYLRDREVTRVVIAGLAADYCVYYTMLDALQEGFEVTLIEDATRPIDADAFSEKKREIREKGAKIMTADDWQAQSA